MLVHQLLDQLALSRKCIRDRVSEVNFIVGILEIKLKGQLVIFAVSPLPGHSPVVPVYLAHFREFWDTIAYVFTSFFPSIVFWWSFLVTLSVGFRVFCLGLVFFRLETYFHALAEKTRLLCKIDDVELDFAEEALVLHGEIEPLVVAPCVRINPHIQVEFLVIFLYLNGHVEVATLEVWVEEKNLGLVLGEEHLCSAVETILK